MKKNNSNATKNGEFVITRLFDGSREKVWRAWTNPEQVKRWWGPKHFSAPSISIDLRVGGKYIYCMRSPEGEEYWSAGIYQEIVPQEKLVMSDSFADEKGNVVPATYYGMSPDWPLELPVTIKFEDQSARESGKTKLTLSYEGIEKIDAKELGNMRQGWNESLDKLAESLK